MSIIEKAVDRLSKEDQARSDDAAELLSARASDSDVHVDANEDQPGLESGVEHAVRNVDESPVPEHVDISFKSLNIEGLLSPEGGRTRLDEEYRMVKRPLLVRAFAGTNLGGCPLNLIMVTSALSGEGKTFTTMNLAISIAMEMDRTVLMIDSDLAKPSLSRHLQVSDRPGFTECLKDPDLDLGQFLLRTDVPKLTVLSAGTRNNRATELLASNTMKSRLQELSSRYSDRIVLFDSPPLLATSESSVLASHMGQVAVVVEYGGTPQFLVREAIGMLRNEDAVSLILNKTRDDFLSKHVGGYGYGYGKGYGYGAYGEK
ncbi:MAG: XrtA-associated tyrosine autokinase [Gammaproteobacteria bacterium]|nr:XrtA-associated tyrosine autokinase [Gammaproteobacteria bacterium]